jgi:hypothetical protein
MLDDDQHNDFFQHDHGDDPFPGHDQNHDQTIDVQT